VSHGCGKLLDPNKILQIVFKSTVEYTKQPHADDFIPHGLLANILIPISKFVTTGSMRKNSARSTHTLNLKQAMQNRRAFGRLTSKGKNMRKFKKNEINDDTDNFAILEKKISELNLELQLLKLKNLKSGGWTAPWREVDMNM
jgi:hypothetical protein